MQVQQVWWGGDAFVTVCGEGSAGDPGAEFARLIDRIEEALGEAGLSLDDAVFHRLWARSREDREAIGAVRESRFGGNRRTASSSFIAANRFSGAGAVALEVIARRARGGDERRLVDFDPPRRYAHFMLSGGWLFLSGMAETGNSMEQRFANSFAEVESGLRKAGMDWKNVLEAALFVERGQGTTAWLHDAFLAAVPLVPGRILVEYVDGLASTDKHLEIEIVARR